MRHCNMAWVRNVVQVLDFFIPGLASWSPPWSAPWSPPWSLVGEMSSFTEIYMIMELCDSDLKKLCRSHGDGDGWCMSPQKLYAYCIVLSDAILIYFMFRCCGKTLGVVLADVVLALEKSQIQVCCATIRIIRIIRPWKKIEHREGHRWCKKTWFRQDVTLSPIHATWPNLDSTLFCLRAVWAAVSLLYGIPNVFPLPCDDCIPISDICIII